MVFTGCVTIFICINWHVFLSLSLTLLWYWYTKVIFVQNAIIIAHCNNSNLKSKKTSNLHDNFHDVRLLCHLQLNFQQVNFWIPCCCAASSYRSVFWRLSLACEVSIDFTNEATFHLHCHTTIRSLTEIKQDVFCVIEPQSIRFQVSATWFPYCTEK